MKANELMIGDWVHVEAHRGFIAQNVKVETIPDNDGDNKYGHHYGHIGTWLYGGDNDFRDVEAKHLQPIPLTPEILEKNGFSVDYCNNDLSYAQSCGDVIGIHINGKNGLMDEMYFKYVHELQHALRLCGIEKEIEL